MRGCERRWTAGSDGATFGARGRRKAEVAGVAAVDMNVEVCCSTAVGAAKAVVIADGRGLKRMTYDAERGDADD